MTAADAWQVFAEWEKEYRAQSDGIEASYDELQVDEKSMLFAREAAIASKARDAALEEAAGCCAGKAKRYGERARKSVMHESRWASEDQESVAEQLAEEILALKGAK